MISEGIKHGGEEGYEKRDNGGYGTCTRCLICGTTYKGYYMQTEWPGEEIREGLDAHTWIGERNISHTVERL